MVALGRLVVLKGRRKVAGWSDSLVSALIPAIAAGERIGPCRVFKSPSSTYNSTAAIQTRDFLFHSLSPPHSRNANTTLHSTHPSFFISGIFTFTLAPLEASYRIFGAPCHGLHRYQPRATTARTTETSSTCSCRVGATMGLHRRGAASCAFNNGRHAS